MQLYDSIPPELASWLLAQPVFFVASAPLRGRHVNVSPKGRPASSLAILGPNEVAYVDGTGSGSETVSHVRENGRLTLMACSFGPAPRILRLFAWASVIEKEHDDRFYPLIARMKLDDGYIDGARAALHLRVFTAQTSCGYGVPRLALRTDPDTNEPTAFLADRDTLLHWAANKIKNNALTAYQAEHNAASMDGLPSLWSAVRRARGGRGRWAYEARVWTGRHRRGIELVMAVWFGAVLATLMLYGAGYMQIPGQTQKLIID